QFSSLTPNLINANLQSILKPAHPPQFTWSKLTGAAVYEIEIARDRDFGKTVLNEESKSESFTWAQAAPGKYFWHIRAKNTQGSISKYSEPGRIQLELAPVTLPPEIHATADEGHVQVSWPAMALASSYKVLVSRDAGFANVDQTQFAKKENAHLKISEAGTYFFKIAALDTSENEVSAFSNPAKLIVVNAVHMQAPTLMSPPPDANFPAGGGAMMFLLLWSKVETAESYDMEIANAADFKHILVKKEIKTNRLTLKQNLPKGQIYWRIRAKGKGAESPWSPTSRFEIQ
ncbi:MAG: hypothetical protein ACXVA9_08085, partial [Bdellovibrionales bacterium]